MNNNQNINNTMLSRYADNLTNITYITNPAIAREEEIKRLKFVKSEFENIFSSHS